MVKQPVSVSDWIQYFCHTINTGYAIVFGALAIIVTMGIGSYSLNLFEKWLIFIPSIASEVIIILFIFGRQSRFKKAQIFLTDIMTGKKDDPKKIGDEWFIRKKPHRTEKYYSSWGKRFEDVGAIIIFISFGAVIFAIYWTGKFTLDIVSPMAIPITLGLSFIAIGIAFDSDNKMIAIANANFLNIVNMVEDVRINFLIGAYHPETFTWKTLSCLEMAKELLAKDVEKKFIKNEYQNKLVHYFNKSLEVFFDEGYSWTKLKRIKRGKNIQEHIIQAYRIIQDFYKEPNIKKELDDILTTKLNQTERNDFNKRL
jgi:hypothetical protein